MKSSLPGARTRISSPLFVPGIYAILDRKRLSELLSLGNELLSHADVIGIQVRAKTLAESERYELIKTLANAAGPNSPPLIINDRPDWAAEFGLGLHLGQEDESIRRAREICGPATTIGVSTHTLDQALRAEAEGASYIGYGPIYSTKSKDNPLPPRDLRELAAVTKGVSIPIVAIGGLTPDNIEPLLSRGVRHFAMLSALHSMTADDLSRTNQMIRDRSRI